MEGVSEFREGDDPAKWLVQFSRWLNSQPDIEAVVKGLALRSDRNATVGGTLDVSGNTTVGGTLAVTGASTLTGTVNIDGAVDIDAALDVLTDLTVRDQARVVTSLTVGSTNDAATHVSLYLSSTSKAMLLNNVNSTVRDALTPSAGMLIYNSDTGKLNFYNGSSWVVVTS